MRFVPRSRRIEWTTDYFNEADGQTPSQIKAPLRETTPRMDDSGIKLKSLDRVPTDDALHADRVPWPNERKRQPFVPWSVYLPNQRRARASPDASRSAHVVVDGCATSSIGHAPRGRNVRSTDGTRCVSRVPTSKDSRGKKIGRGREPTDTRGRSRSTFSLFFTPSRIRGRRVDHVASIDRSIAPREIAFGRKFLHGQIFDGL